MKVITDSGHVVELDAPLAIDIEGIEKSLDMMYTSFIDHELANDKEVRVNVNCDCVQLKEFLRQLKSNH